MTTEAPKLQTVDDRLARIEDLLIKLSTRLDRMEQMLSMGSVSTNTNRRKS